MRIGHLDERCILGVLDALWGHLHNVHSWWKRVCFTDSCGHTFVDSQNFSVLEPNHLYCHEPAGTLANEVHSICCKSCITVYSATDFKRSKIANQGFKNLLVSRRFQKIFQITRWKRIGASMDKDQSQWTNAFGMYSSTGQFTNQRVFCEKQIQKIIG